MKLKKDEIVTIETSEDEQYISNDIAVE